jgi:hypothetical protein
MDEIGSGLPMPDRHGQNERVMTPVRTNQIFGMHTPAPLQRSKSARTEEALQWPARHLSRAKYDENRKALQFGRCEGA